MDNSVSNLITNVNTPAPNGNEGDGYITVERAQTLTAGTLLKFGAIYKTINFAGNIVINSYPSASRTIYLDLDRLITVGTQA